jgi:signal transduction histidine kinase
MDMDMIITDWMMPGLDGLDLCKKNRSSNRAKYTYIIGLTAKDREKDLIEMFEAGVDDYITKPFDPEELRVRVLIGQRILELENKHTELINTLMESRNKLEQVLSRLKHTQAQILQSQKMSSIGQLAAGIVHEINNPTGYVSSNLKTLSDYQEDMKKILLLYQDLVKRFQEVGIRDDSLGQFTDQIKMIQNEYNQLDMDHILQDATDLIQESREGIERIKRIISDLKDFTHPEVDELQFMDINRIIDSTLNIVWNEIKYKAIVEKDYGVLPQVRCYPRQLNQVFMNVLMNAAQAIERKGVINVSTRSENGHVWIKISDTGRGIPRENIPKVFDPFYTTKEVGEGTGLGLNVAYDIIKKHDGTIVVYSDAGKGSTFTIRIPVDQVKTNS